MGDLAGAVGSLLSGCEGEGEGEGARHTGSPMAARLQRVRRRGVVVAVSGDAVVDVATVSDVGGGGGRSELPA